MTRRRVSSIIAHGVAVAALIVLGLRPTRVVPGTTRDIVLATPGATPTAVARLADSLHAPVVRMPDSVADAGMLARRGPLGTIHVAGWGLDDAGWDEVPDPVVVPHPAPLPPGFTAASWPAAIVLGEPLAITGGVRGAGPRAQVVLEADGAAVDSAAVDSLAGAFALRDLPRAAGRRTYVLRVAPAGRVAAETLGVRVDPVPSLRVLILAGAPSFELRAVRDWLGGHGAAVAARTLVSRERWHTDFVNRPAMRLGALESGRLGEEHLLLIDVAALRAMSDAERAAVRGAVTRTGLGVLVLPDTAPAAEGLPAVDRAFFLGFAAAPAGELDERLVRPALPGLAPPRTPIPALPLALRERFAVETVVRDGAGVALVQVAPRGAGRVAISLAGGTARWLRAGEPEAYAAFWGRVLGSVARGPAPRGVAHGGPHRVDEPLAVVWPAAERRHVEITGPSAGRDTVYLSRDPLDPARAVGTFWPRHSGWHTVEGAAAFYVSAPDAWATAHAAERLAATARAAAVAPGFGDGVAPRSGPQRRPLPLGWVFVLFVLATGYLWATRR